MTYLPFCESGSQISFIIVNIVFSSHYYNKQYWRLLLQTTTGQCSVCTLLCPACQCSMSRVFEAFNVRCKLFEHVPQTVKSTSIWLFSQCDHLFVLSYLSRSLADRWGTTVDFTTSFLHSSRFSAFRSVMFHGRPVHCLCYITFKTKNHLLIWQPSFLLADFTNLPNSAKQRNMFSAEQHIYAHV